MLLMYMKPKQSNNEEKNDEEKVVKTIEDAEQEYINTKSNSVMYKENSTLEQLKEEYKITGDNDLYQVETESDGRKVVNVKPLINYKVAFAGMIKNTMPNFKEIDEIYEKNHPTQKGIWINSKDREKIGRYLKNNSKLKAKYKINEEGYLKIEEISNLSNIDEAIKNLINGDKLYILNISSNCYMLDVVTGEIVENRYNDLEEKQTYEYFETEDKMIIFISENAESKLTSDEIFDSLIELLK